MGRDTRHRRRAQDRLGWVNASGAMRPYPITTMHGTPAQASPRDWPCRGCLSATSAWTSGHLAAARRDCHHPDGGPMAGQPSPPCAPPAPSATTDSGGSRLWREGLDAGVVRMHGMATHVVGGEVMGCGSLEAGGDIVMGVGSTAREPRDDLVCIGRELQSAGCSPRCKALDDRFEIHSQEGPASGPG